MLFQMNEANNFHFASFGLKMKTKKKTAKSTVDELRWTLNEWVKGTKKTRERERDEQKKNFQHKKHTSLVQRW